MRDCDSGSAASVVSRPGGPRYRKRIDQYVQLDDTIVIESTFSFGAFVCDEDVMVEDEVEVEEGLVADEGAEVLDVELELPAAGSSVPLIVTL